jgi:modulator of FtsH protease
MMEPSPLAGWDNFFVIAGSSAAALTGLTFIVITLSAQGGRVNPNGLKVFITPTIVHFTVVLAFSAFLSMPHHTSLSLCVSLLVAGVLGLIYIGTIAISIRGMTSTYVPVHEDWIWNVILPGIAYGTWLAAGFLIWRSPHASLYAVAAVLVLLMLIGIHNAWDIAVWNSTRKATEDSKETDRQTP